GGQLLAVGVADADARVAGEERAGVARLVELAQPGVVREGPPVQIVQPGQPQDPPAVVWPPLPGHAPGDRDGATDVPEPGEDVDARVEVTAVDGHETGDLA